MPNAAYDHHQKAGNEGDVVKHVALIAALDSLLDQHRGGAFRYADVYAGHAHHCLRKGGEWISGIGKLRGRWELKENPHTALYFEWYLSRPQFEGGFYPGSSLIAADVCNWKKKAYRLSLWDTNETVVKDLKTWFSKKVHRIHARPASPSEEDIRSACILFIDPPDGKKETWEKVAGFLRNPKQSLVVWLPVGASKTQGRITEYSAVEFARVSAKKLDLSGTKVVWRGGIRMIGCQLIYRLDADSIRKLRAAVEQVVKVVGGKWRAEHLDP